MPNRPFLITGCQRSGTTLTHLILDSHPDIHGVDEELFRHDDLNRYLYGHRYRPFVSFKLPAYAPILPFLKSIPEMKIAWCIRDPVDVVASMISLEQDVSPEGQTVPWAAHPHCALREIRNAYWVLGDTVRDTLRPLVMKFRQEIKPRPAPEWSRDDLIFTAALCWRIKNELPDVYTRQGIEYHTIRYEQLVIDAERETRNLLEHFEARWDSTVLQHHLLHRGVSVGNTDNQRPIDKNSMGKGKRMFDERELALIHEVCGAAAARWKYID